MKRLLPCLLSLLLLLSACAAPSEVPSVTTGGETNPPAVTTGEKPDGALAGDHIQPTYNSLQEYEQMLRSVKVPEDFVTYEHLSMLGGFVAHVNNGVLKGTYSYTLSDGARKLDVLILPRSYHESKYKDVPHVEPSDRSDFRRQDSEGAVYVKRGEAEYLYLAGKLEYVQFVWSDQIIMITVGAYLEGERSDSTVSRLLYADTAQVALKEILNANPFA